MVSLSAASVRRTPSWADLSGVTTPLLFCMVITEPPLPSAAPTTTPNGVLAAVLLGCVVAQESFASKGVIHYDACREGVLSLRVSVFFKRLSSRGGCTPTVAIDSCSSRLRHLER